MLSNLEALVALAEEGTMGRAALKLHVTQSAVSKRIHALETELDYQLIEKTGRKVQLTPAAARMLERVRPLLVQLKEELAARQSEAGGKLSLAVSVSVLISGGAKALAAARAACPGLELVVSANHASVAIERVRSGECMLALVQGKSEIAADLHARLVAEQTMVIVPAGLKRFSFPKKGAVEVLGMADHTEAWKFIQRGFRSAQADWGFTLKRAATLESFAAITEMSRAGFGNGIVPLGVARALGVPRGKLVFFPRPGLRVPVSLVGRQSTLARPLVQKFFNQLSALLGRDQE